jgi:hypothetical protein
MMKVSLERALAMNNPSREGFPSRPAGVPTNYNWYNGFWLNQPQAPANFSCIAHWGQFHRKVGAERDGTGKAESRNHKGWMRRKSDKVWVLVQEIGPNFKMEGGMFDAKFTTNAAVGGAIEQKAEQGGALFKLPDDNQCNHFWPGPRGKYNANQFDFACTYMEARLTDPSDVGHFILQAGGDWWPDPNNGPNPVCGHGCWYDLTNEFQPYIFYSCPSDQVDDYPPPCIGEEEGSGGVDPAPTEGWSGTIVVEKGLIKSVT